MILQSKAFSPGGPIPRLHTGDGKNASPPLTWSGVPDGTREFALICDDPDAPTPQPWVHWVLYGIPANLSELPEGLPSGGILSTPATMFQGRNSWTSGRTIGYRGPLPPPRHGVHHYSFRLYALDAPLHVNPALDKQLLLEAMNGHILEEAELVGTYER